MNLVECDKCKYNFRRTNELEDHIQDYHCIEYTVSLNCETGSESVIESNNKLENNNIECSTNVPANQEPFKDSENKEDGYNRNKLNCVICKKPFMKKVV